MRPQLCVKRMFPVVYLLPTLLIIVMLNLGGISVAQRDAPINPTPQSSDGMRGIPVIDTADSDDLEAPQAFTGCANVTQIPTKECRALVVLYNSTNGPNWNSSRGWKQTNLPCTWYGIKCANNHVTTVLMQDNNLSGQIPPKLGDLTNLKNLYLDRNQLTGTIPPKLGKITALQLLFLDSNQLTGAIPPELGNLSNLTYVRLYENQLSGAIPPELGNLINVGILDLYSNQLSGAIPPELGNLTNLAHLSLDDNQLSGTIPPELGNLSNLMTLYLNDNQLSGAIPPELGNLPNLEFLWLSSNQLNGSIPPELGNFWNLRGLYLNNNQLSGSIPPELSNLSYLSNLYLNDNQLSGSIPPELGNLSYLTDLYLNDNQLSGGIPPELGNLSNLRNLYLDTNQLSGGIPFHLSNLINLEYLWLHNNRLSGPIPPQFASLNLYFGRMDIRFNALTAYDPDLITFLNGRQPNWQYYQTVPPSNVALTVDSFQDLIVSWTPVPSDVSNLKGWYYEVGCGTQSGGPYNAVSLSTKNIYTSQLTLSSLIDDTYFCAVRTFSPSRPGETEGWWSEYSAEVSGTITNPTPIVRGDTFDAPVVMNNLNAQFWSLNAEDATADALLPVPSCATDIDPAIAQSIIYQLPVDLSGDIAIISGGPRYFKDRADPDTADTVLVIYEGDTFPTPQAEVACDDDGGPVGGGSNVLLTTYEPGETYTVVVWMRDIGAEGLVFDVDQTQIVSTNGDFSLVNPNNAKLPRKWQAINPGKSRLVCDVGGATNLSFSTPCAFQLVASSDQSPVLQQTVKAADFPSKINSGSFQGAVYLKRMNTSGAARMGIEITYKNGLTAKKSVGIPPRGCDEPECSEAYTHSYTLLKTPLISVEKAVKSVSLFVILNGDKGKIRVDDMNLYYIP